MSSFNTWNRFWRSWILVFLGLGFAAWTADGIEVDSWAHLLGVAAVLCLLNILIRPILILFALPFVIFTLGLGIWIINALLLLLAAELTPGFEVDSFWHALWGAFLISVVTMAVNMLTGKPKVRMQGHVNINRGNSGQNPNSRQRIRHKKDEDVIDV